MDFKELERLMNRKAKEIRAYANARFPAQAGNAAIRFINGNFRAQGWQGRTFQKWKPNSRRGRVLVKTGHLRSATYYVTGVAKVIVRNTMPYAAIHNQGGTLNIPVTDKMRRYAWAMYYRQGGGKKKGGNSRQAGKWKGLALTKKTFLNIKIEQRQFAPTPSSPSPVLEKAIKRNIERELKRIFTN